MNKQGFDNEKYLNQQFESILERVKDYDGKLYLEFGGKLMYDFHAARVLPGYDPNVKVKLLSRLKDEADIIVAIYAGDIERKKMRADFGITYDMECLKLIDDFKRWELNVAGVVITRYEGQPAATQFMNKLKRRGIKTYTHGYTKGYPTDINKVVSDEGYGANPYIETENKLVIVTAPGPGSGKLATCLNQLYHDSVQGKKSGYAKFETFPIWNVPLNHPVNIAYESATADLKDFNVIDPYHMEAYNKTTVNYNRDVDSFPLLKRILEKITGEASVYKSPTDMGVNMVGYGIVDDEAVRHASQQEIIRRCYVYECEYMKGLVDKETVERAELIMENLGLVKEDRLVVTPAREAAKGCRHKNADIVSCGAAIMLKDGDIITGKNSEIMNAASSVILNAIKHMAGIPDNIHLLSPSVIESIIDLKKRLKENYEALSLQETLIALSISATNNHTAKVALETLEALSDCDFHCTHMLIPGDESEIRKLGIRLTSDPLFPSNDLYMK
ncbi:DUF1846 domain-containing protein [Fusibacter sp. JL216-2]|uniref:DUF1846 domain-containing protein n=1 Tax=Fusibacter sp. JL216-2 TaxID=3071453 RepID=UPI003D358237